MQRCDAWPALQENRSCASMQRCDAWPALQENPKTPPCEPRCLGLEKHASMQRCDAWPALQENRSLLRTLDCFTEGMLILDTSTPAWQVLHANEAWSACTGEHSGAGVGSVTKNSGCGRAHHTEGSTGSWWLQGGNLQVGDCQGGFGTAHKRHHASAVWSEFSLAALSDLALMIGGLGRMRVTSLIGQHIPRLYAALPLQVAASEQLEAWSACAAHPRQQVGAARHVLTCWRAGQGLLSGLMLCHADLVLPHGLSNSTAQQHDLHWRCLLQPVVVSRVGRVGFERNRSPVVAESSLPIVPIKCRPQAWVPINSHRPWLSAWRCSFCSECTEPQPCPCSMSQLSRAGFLLPQACWWTPMAVWLACSGWQVVRFGPSCSLHLGLTAAWRLRACERHSCSSGSWC